MTMRKGQVRGTTLLELLIVIFLFGILIYCVYLFIDRGITMYRESVDALEVRQEALLGLTRLADEVRDSAPLTIHCEPPPLPAPQTGTHGIVFPSTRDVNGTVVSDTTSGRVFWQKYVCYYLEAQPDGQNFIVRKEQTCPDPDGDGPESDVIPDPYGELPPMDPAFFAGSGLAKRVICKKVTLFEVSKETDLVAVKMQVDLTRRYRHMVEVQTKIFPRL